MNISTIGTELKRKKKLKDRDISHRDRVTLFLVVCPLTYITVITLASFIFKELGLTMFTNPYSTLHLLIFKCWKVKTHQTDWREWKCLQNHCLRPPTKEGGLLVSRIKPIGDHVKCAEILIHNIHKNGLSKYLRKQIADETRTQNPGSCFSETNIYLKL